MASELAVETSGLTKAYGEVGVLAGVDLRVARGGVFALLGPNGAGKTTIVRVLATLIRADAGAAFVDGHDVVRERHLVRRSISLTGQYAAVDELQTGQENLRMMGRLRGLSRGDARRRADELLDRFDLAAAGRRRVATYSGGMRRRLDLAASLLGRPSVIFLDEPTTGLDPRSRAGMWEVIGELVDTGVTIFLTTQYLEEADQVADLIAVLDDGTVVAQGSPAELKRSVGGQRLELIATGPAAFAGLVGRLGERVAHSDRGRAVVGVATDGSATHARALLDEIDPDRTAVASFTVHGATLDDAFLRLTGHPATPDATDAAADPATDSAPDPAADCESASEEPARV